MLNYLTLENKPEVRITKDGETTIMKDLTTRSIKDTDVIYSKFVTVNKYCVARPDLVSFMLYGTDKYADILCKMNGISNPFELNEGMILIYPPAELIKDKVIHSQSPSELVSPNSKINSNGIDDNVFKDFTTSMLSNDRIKHDLLKNSVTNGKSKPSSIGKTEAKNGKKLKNERRSPGEQTINDTNYVINRSLGVVIY